MHILHLALAHVFHTCKNSGSSWLVWIGIWTTDHLFQIWQHHRALSVFHLPTDTPCPNGDKACFSNINVKSSTSCALTGYLSLMFTDMWTEAITFKSSWEYRCYWYLGSVSVGVSGLVYETSCRGEETDLVVWGFGLGLCWAFFDEGAVVQVPLQVLSDDGAQEAEGLHSVHWGFTQGDGGRWSCVLPKIHNHICLDSVEQ